jgi:hypothetical protein
LRCAAKQKVESFRKSFVVSYQFSMAHIPIFALRGKAKSGKF